ncbi:SDR family oxidoreductase [Curtobacterium pusillum]|uniref:NAD(P)H-binding protein n=1 Tax=Curtobacterium pusillum TaxID=69373 RepID=A0ABX2M4R8_9MICO|nr:NAD(P)H-binding protein [Curtobacterium pusillum]NUU12871.1 NAD(P)H-binding protein [Curtobacterium pusillum]
MGDGLDAALVGVDTIVNTLNIARFDDEATHFFETTTRNLVQAGDRAGVRHHVLLSIVGVGEEDGPDNGYWRGKVAQERVLKSATVPATIVRTTQFHSWVSVLADQHTVDGRVIAERSLIQPVDLAEVVSLLETVALETEPSDHEIDLAGPERYFFDDLLRGTLAAAGDEREVVTVACSGPIDLVVPRGRHQIGAKPYPIRGIPTAG